MNKKDFLDILRDYLKGSFTEYEINDIIRDYEEFFLNGELQGKTEEEVIASLGSPKTIANDLIREMKGESSEKEFKGSNKFDYKSTLRRLKNLGYKGMDKSKDFLSSSDILSAKIPTWMIKALVLILIVFTFPFILAAACGVILGGLLLVAGTIASIAGLVLPFTSFLDTSGTEYFVFFISLIGLGVVILLWTIYGYLISFAKSIIVGSVSWVKTRLMYIRVKNKKDSEECDEESEGEEDEED